MLNAILLYFLVGAILSILLFQPNYNNSIKEEAITLAIVTCFWPIVFVLGIFFVIRDSYRFLLNKLK